MMVAVINIDEGGKRIIAKIPFAGGRGPKQAKEVPGARAKWDKKVTPNKFLGWTYPLTLDTCYAFRRVFGVDLIVSDELAAWAHSEIARQRDLEDFREGELERAKEFDLLPEEAPQLYLAMKARPYQLTGVAFMITGGQTILGDEPGLGKTVQGLAAIIESDSRTILVACPKSATYSVWQRETERWTETIATYVAQGTHAERESVMEYFTADVMADRIQGWPHPRRMLIVNTEMMRAKREEVCPEGLDPEYCNSRTPEARGDHRHHYNSYPDWPFLHKMEWDAIILDESHNSLASTANIQSKRITQVRFGAMQLRKRLRDGGLAVAMSGTPFRSKLEKSWGTLNWLRPDMFGSFWRFAEQHFGVMSNGWGKVVGRNKVEGGEMVVEPIDQEAFDKAIRPYYLARKKSEVAADLPPIIYAGTPPSDDHDGPNYVRLEMDAKQKKLYHQMQQEASADIEGGRILANGVLAEITRLRQFATACGRRGDDRKVLPELPSNKIEWIIDFMREREDTDAKVVIASSFTEVVELVASILRKEKWEVLTLTGATIGKSRALLQKRFQDPDDPLRVVVLNSKAGGEAITLDRADEMVVIDTPWTSDEFKQLRDRIHRVSRIHQVTIYRLISNGTIEEWMASLTDEQRRIMESANPKKLSEMLRRSNG